MVTKSAGTQIRRTYTAGKVFSAGEVLEGQLALNLTDRNLYSKNQSGTVFQVAAAPGRNVGNSPVYESFVGSTGQGLGVRNGENIWMRHDKDKGAEFATLWVTRIIEADADRTGEQLGGTSAAIRVDCRVEQLAQKSSQWPMTVTLDYKATGGDAGDAQHVASFVGVDKRNPSAFIWCQNLGFRDYNPNPTRGSVVSELTVAVSGPDNNGQRFGLHVACNSIGQNGGPDSQPGINGVYAAIVAGGPAANVQFNRMVKLEGTGKVVIDASNVSFESGDVMMRMNEGHKLQWGTYGNMENTPKAQIAWFPSLQTFGLDGVKTQFTAGQLVAYKVIQFDGTELCIPVYLKS